MSQEKEIEKNIYLFSIINILNKQNLKTDISYDLLKIFSYGHLTQIYNFINNEITNLNFKEDKLIEFLSNLFIKTDCYINKESIYIESQLKLIEDFYDQYIDNQSYQLMKTSLKHNFSLLNNEFHYKGKISVDISELTQKKYSFDRLSHIILAMKSGKDYSIFQNLNVNDTYFEIIQKCQLLNLDIDYNIFTDNKLSYKRIVFTVNMLIAGIDISDIESFLETKKDFSEKELSVSLDEFEFFKKHFLL